MNAVELFHADGKPAGVHYCANCRCVRGSLDDAEQCCRPSVCPCGAECPRGWLSCDACRAAEYRRRQYEHFASVQKQCIDDYDGVMVCIGDRVLTVDGLEEHVNDMLAEFIADGGDLSKWEPPIVYATSPTQHMIDVDAAIEHALDEAYEGAERDIDKQAIADLTATVDAWSRAHMPTTHYEVSLALTPWPV